MAVDTDYPICVSVEPHLRQIVAELGVHVVVAVLGLVVARATPLGSVFFVGFVVFAVYLRVRNAEPYVARDLPALPPHSRIQSTWTVLARALIAPWALVGIIILGIWIPLFASAGAGLAVGIALNDLYRFVRTLQVEQRLGIRLYNTMPRHWVMPGRSTLTIYRADFEAR